MNKTLRLLSGLLLLIGACKREDPAPGPLDRLVMNNVAYGTAPAQQMDVWLPANRSNATTPMLIMIHGGGWKEGDKTQYNSMGFDSFFNARGVAVAAINYRLASDADNKFPTAPDDVGRALDFIESRSESWQINPQKIMLMGSSAGGHLSLYYAYALNRKQRVKAVVDVYGFSDFSHSSITDTPRVHDRVAYFLGAPYLSNPSLWRTASPSQFISRAVPTLIFHGADDTISYPIQSQMLRDSLQLHGVPAAYVEWPATGHRWALDSMPAIRQRMGAWLDAYVR